MTTEGSVKLPHLREAVKMIQVKNEGALTPKEKEILNELSYIYNDIKSVVDYGSTGEEDLQEVAFHIHALQRLIMAQAAARVYPEEYRLLGTSFNDINLEGQN